MDEGCAGGGQTFVYVFFKDNVQAGDGVGLEDVDPVG